LEGFLLTAQKGADERTVEKILPEDMRTGLKDAALNMDELSRNTAKTGTAAGDAAAGTKKMGDGVTKIGENAPGANEELGIFRERLIDMKKPLEEAVNLVTALNRQIALMRSKTIVLTTIVRTIYQTSGSPSANTPRGPGSGDRAGTPGNQGSRATGGPMFPGIEYRINERGQEFLKIPFAGNMMPANQAPTGGDTIIINQYISDQHSAALADAEIRRTRRERANSFMGG
jgi:hypothetical protein